MAEPLDEEQQPADEEPVDLSELPRYQEAAAITPRLADARFGAGLVVVEVRGADGRVRRRAA